MHVFIKHLKCPWIIYKVLYAYKQLPSPKKNEKKKHFENEQTYVLITMEVL